MPEACRALEAELQTQQVGFGIGRPRRRRSGGPVFSIEQNILHKLKFLSQAFAEALKLNTSVTDVCLSGNEIGDLGAKAQFC